MPLSLPVVHAVAFGCDGVDIESEFGAKGGAGGIWVIDWRTPIETLERGTSHLFMELSTC